MEDRAQTGLDMTKVMILLQRKYSSVRELVRLTRELGEALERYDEISANMLLQMRADEMAKIDGCMDEIWQIGEVDRESMEQLRILITSEPSKTVKKSLEEKKIYEIREKTQAMLDELLAVDKRLNQSVAREKSYYKSEGKNKENRSIRA
ncbi:hypothetical protein AALB16_03420 [Lachnospiraceae bacterium 62-35]